MDESQSQPLGDDSVNARATAPAAKRRRRWLQFSLRSLLLLILLCAGGAFAWRTYLEPYRRQRQTMALIETLGGSYQTSEASAWLRGIYGGDFQNVVLVNLADCDDPAAYLPAIAALPKLETLVVGGPDFGDEQLRVLQRATGLRNLVLDSTSVSDEALAALTAERPGLAAYRSDRRTMNVLQKRGAMVGATEPTAPAELRELLGDECLARCRYVGYEHLRSRKITATDEDLALLSGLTQIEILGLTGAGISDTALAHLAKLQKLHTLHLEHMPIGDAGLAHLKQLAALRVLALDGTRITDAGLTHLKGISGLWLLDLSDTAISDAGLKELNEFPNLRHLRLDGTRTSDAGLARFNRRSKLTNLSLARTEITGAGLVHLKALDNLQSLHLDCTRISDAGLAHVAELGQLRALHLNGTQVTDAGLAHLTQLGQLQSLTLGRMWIDKDALPELKAPDRNTTHRVLFGPRVTDAGIVQLKRFTSLSMLDLSDTEFSEAGLAQLKALRMLQRLELGNRQISNAVSADLRQGLPMCQITYHGGRLWPTPRQ